MIDAADVQAAIVHALLMTYCTTLQNILLEHGEIPYVSPRRSSAFLAFARAAGSRLQRWRTLSGHLRSLCSFSASVL